MRLKIRIEQNVLEGTGTEIVNLLRQWTFDPDEFPDTESYILQLQDNYTRTTGLACDLPRGSTETRARAMLMQLAKIGALGLLEG